MKINLQLTAAAISLSLGIMAQNGKKVASTNNVSSTTVNEKIISIKESPYFNNRGCASKTPSQQWDADFNAKVEEFKQNLQTGKAQAVNVTIPIIVHVIHTGQSVGTFPNLLQGQINSQITVLNADYSGTGYNVGNLPAVFQTAKANTGIQFCLAQKNPTGSLLTEPGIDRINANSISTPTSASYPSKNPAATNYNSPSTFQSFVDGYIKPNTIWDPTRYFNVWITDEQASVGLLGYATFPVLTGTTIAGISGSGSATTDGVWCWAKSFGSNTIFAGGTYDATYNKGRTLTHESGHWVGLRHTWGDGTCATDYCNDTPPSQQANYGCPTHPYKLGICSGNTTGEMFQNFMDYTDDPCMYIFTNDQNARIQTAMQYGNYRNQLGTSATTLCTIAAAAPVASLSIPASACSNSAVATNNQSTGNPSPTYAWSANPSGGVTFNPSNTATAPTINFTTPGNYSVTVVATNSAGTNSNTKVITITTCTMPAVACTNTITNFNNTDTLLTVRSGSANPGYVGGNNGYGDLEKGEYFSSTGLVGTSKVVGGIVLFYRHQTANIGTKGTGNVVFKLYNGNNTAGPSGAAINTFTASLTSILATPSQTQTNLPNCGNPSITYNSIIKPYSFSFPVATNITGDFIMSVQLPTTTGDTAVIFMSSVNGRTASTAWELQTPSTWVPFNDGLGSGGASWAINSSLAILPKVQCISVGTIENSILDKSISLYPNPSKGLVSIIATLPNTQNIEISVNNMMGQLISKSKYTGITNEVITLDLNNNSNGVYFVTINNGQEKIVKRVILNK